MSYVNLESVVRYVLCAGLNNRVLANDIKAVVDNEGDGIVVVKYIDNNHNLIANELMTFGQLEGVVFTDFGKKLVLIETIKLLTDELNSIS